MVIKALSRSEKETVVCRAADEAYWHIRSVDPTVIRKLTKIYGKGKTIMLGYVVWEVPKKCVSFRKIKASKKAEEDEDE